MVSNKREVVQSLRAVNEEDGEALIRQHKAADSVSVNSLGPSGSANRRTGEKNKTSKEKEGRSREGSGDHGQQCGDVRTVESASLFVRSVR